MHFCSHLAYKYNIKNVLVFSLSHGASCLVFGSNLHQLYKTLKRLLKFAADIFKLQNYFWQLIKADISCESSADSHEI